MFGRSFTDILSGYRVFSRRFVKSFPVLSGGFEIETELTVHALELELPVGEIATPYYSRPLGSASKLSTWRDGFRILWTVFKLYRAERPLSLFGAVRDCARHHFDRPRHPDFHHVRAGRTGAALAHRGPLDRPDAACVPFALRVGLILDTVTRGRRELKLLAYLALRAPGEERRRS